VIVCWDASAAVKLVRSEAGSALASDLWSGEHLAAAATITLPEVASALARNRRSGALDLDTYHAASERWSLIADQLVLLPIDRARAERAAELVPHRLRGADAVHLAVALELAEHDVEVTLTTWDRRLHEAARSHGLGVAPASV
jgi:predicted nucleic acid-binding protein